MLLVRVVITLLCAVGFYASVFMLRKSMRAARGELAEPSVVQTQRAALVFGAPNSLIGVLYYPALVSVSWLARSALPLEGALAAAILAAGMSAYLAYSLLFITKRSCLYCWASHVVNFSLLPCVACLLLVH